MVIDAAPGKFFRLERDRTEGCTVTVKRQAFIQGRLAGPEIRILPDGQKPLWQAELAPGKQTLAAVCREVTRDAVSELPVSLELDLEPGTIYQLSAVFDVPRGKCDIKAAPLAP